MQYCPQHEPHIGKDHWQINMMFCNSQWCRIRVWFGVTAISAEVKRLRVAQKTVLERLVTAEKPLGSPLTDDMRLA